MLHQLIDKIEKREAVIGIVGMGYVGLPLGLGFIEAGFRVLGVDVDPNKVTALNEGKSYIAHIPSDRIKEAVDANRFEAVTDFERSREADAIIICVPTPLDEHREPDLSFVTGTLDSLLPYLRPGQLVSLESTTYPGTTDEELLPMMEIDGLKVGKDVFLVYSPEREDPANPHFHTRTIPKVCGGVTPSCLKAGCALYACVVDEVVPVSSTKVAELTKLLENIYRSVNIGLVNELKIVADKMDIDIHEVIKAASTKPFGFTPFYPGPGLGGHCIPIDPFYLTWKAREYGVHTRFIELAGEVNRQMPEYVVHKVMEGLNRSRKAVNGAIILILGLAYKKNVDDMRESPAVEIIDILSNMGAEIQYSDPFISNFPRIRRGWYEMQSTELTRDFLEKADCVVLVTDHDVFDYELIAKSAKLIVDARGRFENAPHIVKA